MCFLQCNMGMSMHRLVTVIFIILLNTVTLSGQDISELRINGRGEPMPKELIDKNIRDANGDVCAGLMIVSDLDGLSFDSNNQIVKVNSMPGQNLLFLSPEERFVKIYKTGYKPLEIVLLDHGIRLSSGRVYKIEVTGRKKAELIPVTIHVKPENSRLYVDNVQKAANTTFTLPVGKHEFKAEKEGFYSAIDSVEVNTTKAFFSYTLKPMEDLPVQLNSQPRGARLFIDGKDMGETDTAVYLYPGKYKVKLTKPDYLEKNEVINISESSRNLFTFNLTRDEGTLRLAIEPEDSKVFIDRKEFTGKNNINLTSGRHRVQIEREGYNTVTEVVTIDFGTTAEKSYKLVPRTGRLLFTVQPYEADAVLSQYGKTIYKWRGLNTFNDLPEGEYDLECKSEGYADYRQKISVAEGRSLRVDINMNKSGEGSSGETAKVEKGSSGIPWYYYVGGAVITGGTAAVLLLNKKTDTKSETPIQLPPDRP